MTKEANHSNETLFSKIIKGEIPANIIYQDDEATAFYDIDPKAPVHLLIVPNKIIPTTNDVNIDDEKLLGHLFIVASRLAKKLSVDESGYRLIVNCNKDAGQEVFHLHMHLLAGKQLGPLITP